MRTNLMDQTAGTAKRRYQGTTHSHTKPLIQVSRVEKKRGSELYLLSSPKGTSLSVHSQSNFTLTALHSLHITLPPRRKPVRGPRSVSCGPRGSLRQHSCGPRGSLRQLFGQPLLFLCWPLGWISRRSLWKVDRRGAWATFPRLQLPRGPSGAR